MKPRPLLSSPSPQTRKPPAAPPVYRPQPVAKALQRKTAAGPTPSKLTARVPATRNTIIRGVAQLALDAPAAAIPAAAPRARLSQRQEDELYDKLWFTRLVVHRMKKGSAEINNAKLFAAGGDEVPEISEILSSRFSGDSAAVKQVIRDQPDEVEAIHARISYLYKESQRKDPVVVAPTKYQLQARAQIEVNKLKRRHPNGPDKGLTGKTIGAIIDLDTGVVYADSSGRFGRELDPKTKEVIRGVHEVEDWPVDACAEVNALDQHIRAGLNPIRGKTHLHSYCYTWDYIQKHWTGKGACSNCEQWLKHYK